jgi:hypothetical protein
VVHCGSGGLGAVVRHVAVVLNEERSAAVSNVLRQVGRARNGGKFKI